MKKIFTTFSIILFLILVPKNIFAYGTDFSGSGFYSSIANSMGTLESNLYTIDLAGEEGTKEKLNKIIGQQCITENLTEEEIKNIAERGNIDIIYTKISEDCKNDGNLSITTAGIIINAINALHTNTRVVAITKASQIMNLGSTQIYADGIKDNSPFDLITDLKEIDKIVFAEPTEAYNYDSGGYEGNNTVDLAEKIGGLVEKAKEINSTGRDTAGVDVNLNLGTNYIYNDLKNYTEYNSSTLSNKYVCSLSQSSNTSGLNQSTLSNIYGESKTPSSSASASAAIYDPVLNSSSGYSKVNDNAVFPCTTFFCINIDFVTHNHKLLGGSILGGNQDMSIEAIVSRSNDHLKKFANGSLAQSKMTINNFELGFLDMDLTQLFHQSIQITYKPVPILNVTNNTETSKSQKQESEKGATSKDDKGIFEVSSQLKFYYDSYGLEYSRRNDLSLFTKIVNERQASENSALLTPLETTRLVGDFQNYYGEKAKQRNLMQKLIENETKIQVLGDLETQFKELEIFNRAIKDYTSNLKAIIEKMHSEIPARSGKT